MKLWTKIGAASVVVFAAMQLVTFERTNPTTAAEIRAPEELKTTLRRACYDCHSNQTVWPWYSSIAPVSWLLHHDVTDGRAALNFSDWEALPPQQQAKLRREAGHEVAEGDMPPWYYLPLHRAAVLSDDDKQLLQSWAGSTAGH